MGFLFSKEKIIPADPYRKGESSSSSSSFLNTDKIAKELGFSEVYIKHQLKKQEEDETRSPKNEKKNDGLRKKKSKSRKRRKK